MKLAFFVLPFIFAQAFASDYCYSDVVGACSPVGGGVENCNAKYGAINEINKELQNYVNLLISKNWQFLLLHTHFANYEADRPGFTKLYKKYADKLWEDAIHVAKYITKRGGVTDFTYKKTTSAETNIQSFELTEVASLAKGLDLWKSVAEEAFHIHAEVARRREAVHDAETASYIENQFVHQHAENIRELSGWVNDLKNLLSNPNDANVALWFFDNYIAKQV